MFRDVASADTEQQEQVWGDAAVAWVDEVEASAPRSQDTEDILAQTLKEQELGYCSQFYTRKQLDAKFGQGQWRCQKRFLITQPSGKQRVIDDALRSSLNVATKAQETIYTLDADFPTVLVRVVVQVFLCMWFPVWI